MKIQYLKANNKIEHQHISFKHMNPKKILQNCNEQYNEKSKDITSIHWSNSRDITDTHVSGDFEENRGVEWYLNLK